ncbi:hypothetical protein ACPV5G_20945, partial [Photobacterium damselae]|uniref:hypothetical protein n=1 Tax=Photobacterium damselae TaxID=38293 RepID=UPI00406984E0
MRIELFKLNTLTTDNAHTVNFYEDNSEYCFLSMPLTSITFPFNPEINPEPLALMANIRCEYSLFTSILDPTLTQKLYDAAIKAGFKQDKTNQSELALDFNDSLRLVAPFPSEDSVACDDEERMHQWG